MALRARLWALRRLEAGALEPGGGIKVGQEVLRNAGDPTLKDRGLHTCSDGSIIALKQVTVEEAAEGAGAPRSHELAGEDARLMTPVVYDAACKFRRWCRTRSIT